jgi:hypothetical protein
MIGELATRTRGELGERAVDVQIEVLQPPAGPLRLEHQPEPGEPLPDPLELAVFRVVADVQPQRP